MNESSEKPRISYAAVGSLVLTLLWYVVWGLALSFAIVGRNDPQGWNWLPYLIWGMWGLPVVALAALLAVWALWHIRSRPGQRTGHRLALTALILCLSAAPIWYWIPSLVTLWN